MAQPGTIGFLGGTGPQGRGLAGRFALAGHEVLLGSRDAERGRAAAGELTHVLGTPVRGGDNVEAAEAADIVFVVVPYEAQAATLAPLTSALEGKVVVNCVNAMAFDDLGPYAPAVAGGSAAEECAALLGGARVVSAFHDISARALASWRQPIDADVLVCGDDGEAKEAVIALAAAIPALRGVDCGPLRMSRYVENLTPVLVAINRRYRTHASLRVTGI